MDKFYEVDSDGYFHEEDELSEDVMDLDHTEVLNFLDINYLMLPKEEGVGFYEAMEARMDELTAEEEANIDAMIDEIERNENGT